MNALVIGTAKSGTTIVASVIQKSIADARFLVEPRTIAQLDKLRRFPVPWVVKVLWEHWMGRPFLLKGIVHGETGFSPDRVIAIIRDPRDVLISALMYRVYELVMEGASRGQVDEWLEIVRDKEANPEKYPVIDMVRHIGRIFGVGDTPDSSFQTFLRYTSWIADSQARFHVLKYEDFVGGNTAALSSYLGISLSDDRDVDRSLERVGRSRRSGAWRTMMLPEDVSYLKQRYGAALAQHGYDEWNTLPARLDPAEGSGYIARITDEAFKNL